MSRGYENLFKITMQCKMNWLSQMHLYLTNTLLIKTTKQFVMKQLNVSNLRSTVTLNSTISVAYMVHVNTTLFGESYFACVGSLIRLGCGLNTSCRATEILFFATFHKSLDAFFVRNVAKVL